jgi:quercetin dioxygenase-like cupin family protein
MRALAARHPILGALVLAGLAAGCRVHGPRLEVGPLAAGLEAFLAAHPRPPGQAMRADEVARTASASYHVVQLAGSESPHRHAAHDLTVIVLRGRGMLARDEDRLPQEPGDVVVIPRDTVHWFASAEGGSAVALVVFSPPLDAPDSIPAPRVDSPPSER